MNPFALGDDFETDAFGLGEESEEDLEAAAAATAAPGNAKAARGGAGAGAGAAAGAAAGEATPSAPMELGACAPRRTDSYAKLLSDPRLRVRFRQQ